MNLFDYSNMFGDKQQSYLEDVLEDTKKKRDELLEQLKAHPLYNTHFEKYKNGIIHIKWIKCGKQGCKCQYPNFKHGPYFYFQYKENGKIKQKYLPKDKELPALRDMINLNQRYKKACASVHKAEKELADYMKEAKNK